MPVPDTRASSRLPATCARYPPPSKWWTDLERIGDHASDIAELILRIKSEHAYHIVKHLPVMAASANAMVHDATEAFINQDLDSAMEIIERDDEVDTLFNPGEGRRGFHLFKSSPDQADRGLTF